MPARAISGNLALASIGGTDRLAYVRDATISVERQSIESSVITTTYEAAQAGKGSLSLRANLMSVVSGSTKVNHLDVTAFAIGGTSYIADVESGSCRVEWQLEEGGGVSDGWEYPVCVKKRISGDVVLRVPATSASTLPALFNGAVSGLNVAFSVTINGVATTFNAFLRSLEHQIPVAGVQKYSCQFEGQSTDAGVAVSAPAGTTTILEKALNTTSALAFDFDTNSSTNGTSYSGNAVFESYAFSWSENEMVLSEISMRSQGTVTIAATS
jgi:hypothetical protein